MQKLVLISFILLLLTIQLQAAPLTWSQAVDLAKKNNLSYQAAELTEKSVLELEKASWSGFLPKISASLLQNQTDSDTTLFSQTYGAQINLTQNIFAGFLDVKKNNLAQINSKLATLNKQATAANLSADLKKTFQTALYAQNLKKLAADILQRRKENLNNVKLQFQSGRENKGSVLLSEAYVQQAQYDYQSAQYQEEVTLETLKQSLGLPTSEDIQVIAPTNETTTQQTALNNASPNFAKIAENIPDVLSAQAQEEEARLSAEVNRSAFWPTLDLNGQYGYYDEHFFPEKNKWSIGLTLNIPLFNGGSDYWSYKSNSLKYKSAQYKNQNQQLTSVTQLKETYYNFKQAEQQEKVSRSFSDAALIRAQIARSKYQNGLMSFDDWDLVESDLIQRQKTWLTSQRDRSIQEANWEQAQGLGVFQ